MSQCNICGDNSMKPLLLVTKAGERISQCMVGITHAFDTKYQDGISPCGRIFRENGNEVHPQDMLVWTQSDGNEVMKTGKTVAFT